MSFLNPIAAKVQPYVPGEQPQNEGWVKLNTNENPYDPAPEVFEVLKNLQGERLRKYPHPFGEPLRQTIANLYGRQPGEVLVVNGSDEALNLICRGTLTEKDSTVMHEVTYSLYKTLINMTGAAIEETPSTNEAFGVNLAALAASKAKVAFLPNPNAQTGEFIPPKEILKAVQSSDKLWVIDEAYNSFVEQEDRSFASYVEQAPNAIVINTFSKTHGLAGARIGYAISCNADLMKGLYGIKDSYNEDAVAIAMGKAALEATEYYKDIVHKVITERHHLISEFNKRGFKVLRSEANFILVKGPMPSEEIYEKLKAQKILVRHFKNSLISDWLRISIGRPDEHEALLAAIDS